MFLLINLDDVDIGIGMFIKLFIIVGILAIPLGFLKWFDDNVTIGAIIFACCLAFYIMNVLTIVEWVRDVKDTEKEKKSKEMKSLAVVIIGFIVTSIIGYFIPIKFPYITLKGVASMTIYSFIINIFFGIWLQKKRVGKIGFKGCIDNIIYFIKYRLIGQQLLIGLVSFFIISCVLVWGTENEDLKRTGLRNVAVNLSNYITSNVTYYNYKYDIARNGKTAKEIVQEEINHIRNDIATNQEEINKLSSYDLDNESVESFMKGYISNKNIMKSFVDEYGINISLSYITDDARYNNLYTMVLYDHSIGKRLYYKFDLNNGEIGEQFEDKFAAENYVNDIRGSIIKEKNS